MALQVHWQAGAAGRTSRQIRQQERASRGAGSRVRLSILAGQSSTMF